MELQQLQVAYLKSVDIILATKLLSLKIQDIRYSRQGDTTVRSRQHVAGNSFLVIFCFRTIIVPNAPL
jgi:hypothetical protein